MTGDLAWFPFFVDDWLGGTLSMTQAMLGAYLQALIAQWKSGEFQAIKADKKSLKIICRGPMSSEVREKFSLIKIDGQEYLRNERLAEVYRERRAVRERNSEHAKLGARARWGQSATDAQSNAPGIPEAIASHVPDSNTKDSIVESSLQLSSKSKSPSATPKKPAKPRPRDLLFEAMAAVCRIDWQLCTEEQRGELNQSTGILREKHHTPEEVELFGRWWYSVDWRGKKGQSPTPSQVRDYWQSAFIQPAESKREFVTCG